MSVPPGRLVNDQHKRKKVDITYLPFLGPGCYVMSEWMDGTSRQAA